MQRKLTALLLALTMLFTACGRSGGTAAEDLPVPVDTGETGLAVTIGEPRIPSETELGYKNTVIELPHWAEELGSGAVLGDVFYILAETGEGAQPPGGHDRKGRPL